jgi:predicted metal-dependent peptidase
MYIPDRGYERRRRRTRVAFAVDTSGSMARDLHYAYPAIRFLLNQGVEVHFLCGDVRVEVDVLLRPGDEIPQPRGGGGTDICPLVEAAVAHRPDGLVVYTDAAIPRWPEKTEGTDVLWVVPSGCTPPYGEVVVWQPLH